MILCGLTVRGNPLKENALNIKLPPGFEISRWAVVPGARSMAAPELSSTAFHNQLIEIAIPSTMET
jgi:hypothetical protein